MRKFLAIILIAWLLLVGCRSGSEYPVILELAGSNTVGKGLAPELVRGYFQTKLEVDSITEQSRGAEELDIIGWRAGKPKVIRISSHGTSTGVDSLAQKSADIWMASRNITATENARFDYDMRQSDAEFFVALDGIAIVVNESNPLESLSISQVMKIFSGDIQSWKNLNGRNEKISLYVRDKKSGTYDSFQSIVLKPYKAVLSKHVAGEFEDNAKVSAAVANDPNAIGFTSYKKIAGTKPLLIDDNSGRVYEPNVFTIKTEAYPISRRLYLYRYPNSTNRHAINFTRFARSEVAQELIVKSGFVSPDLFLTRIEDLPSDAPELYRKLLRGASRIPINIYFTPGSHQFDRDALVKLGEINRMLRQKEYVNRQVLLMGFSDASGSLQRQQELALMRARKVQQYLREYGNSRSSAFSFGSQMPLASSLAYEGRQRNSRVEVWVK